MPPSRILAILAGIVFAVLLFGGAIAGLNLLALGLLLLAIAHAV